ncbi:MAG TPA: CpsD/CapB family tyrosine-protein kinase [Pirellulales bacterium]|jgi:capsular exopolysaccharide synthesis family protein|nr:CpsD/CapB family tyrosine-protein kinase [Pirellulales bacterium]
MISALKTSTWPTGARKSLPADPYFQTLWSRLRTVEGATGKLRTMGLTSSRRGEGVSIVTANLAVTAAEHGSRVLLVDANAAHPAVHRLFNIPAIPGWSELLENGGELTDFIQPSGVVNLTLLTAGQNPGALARIPESAWNNLFDDVRHDFDWLLIDLPALDQVGTTLSTAGLLDGMILVIEAERVRWEVANRAKESLVQSQATLLGAVLNKRRQYLPGWIYRAS